MKSLEQEKDKNETTKKELLIWPRGPVALCSLYVANAVYAIYTPLVFGMVDIITLFPTYVRMIRSEFYGVVLVALIRSIEILKF